MFLHFLKLFGRKARQECDLDVPVNAPAQGTRNAGPIERRAKYTIGDVLQHRIHAFRGVVFDIDPEFANSEEWYESIPENVRPHRNQPYYHLFAENESSHYVAYVSEQNLVVDENAEPVSHPEITEVFDRTEAGYALKDHHSN